jgi:hypothetical protein
MVNRNKIYNQMLNFFTNYKSTTKFMFTFVATVVYIAIPSFYYTLTNPTNSCKAVTSTLYSYSTLSRFFRAPL